MRASMILACGVAVGFLAVTLGQPLSVSRADLIRTKPKAARADSPAIPATKKSATLVDGESPTEPIYERSTMEREIEKALDWRVTFEFVDASLNEVVEVLRKTTGLNILLDEEELDLQARQQPRITLTQVNVRLRYALKRLLDKEKLTFDIRDDALVICTYLQETTRLYPVADLVVLDRGKDSRLIADELAALIQNCVMPDRWELTRSISDGPALGGIRFSPESGSFLIYQDREAHEEIDRFLQQLRNVEPNVRIEPAAADKLHSEYLAARKPVDGREGKQEPHSLRQVLPLRFELLQRDVDKSFLSPDQEFSGFTDGPEDRPSAPRSARRISPTSEIATSKAPLPEPGGPVEVAATAPLFENSAAVWEIERALDRIVSVEFVKTPLEEAVNFLEKAGQVRIVLDRDGLANARVDRKRPLTLTLHNVRLRSALKHLLDPIDMTILAKDRSIVVTDTMETAWQLETRIYPVADLVVFNNGAERRLIADEVRALIQVTVLPDFWVDYGGMGSIEYFPRTGCFSIYQCQKVHQEVYQLLTQLREAAARMPAMGVPPEKLSDAYLREFRRVEAKREAKKPS